MKSVVRQRLVLLIFKRGTDLSRNFFCRRRQGSGSTAGAAGQVPIPALPLSLQRRGASPLSKALTSNNFVASEKSH